MASNVELSSNPHNVNKKTEDSQILKKFEVTDSKIEKEREEEDKKNRITKVKFKIIFYILYIFSFFAFLYIAKPILFCLQLYFLGSIGMITKNGIPLIGWGFIFILPLIHLYFDGIKIIVIQETFFMKIYTSILVFF